MENAIAEDHLWAFLSATQKPGLKKRAAGTINRKA